MAKTWCRRGSPPTSSPSPTRSAWADGRPGRGRTMRLGADHVVVRVPATSANLGPGFDAVGLALGLHDEVSVRLVASDEIVVEVDGEGSGEVPTGADHLVVRALRHTLDLAGAPPTGLHVRC